MTKTPIHSISPKADALELHSGDRMTQPEFHRIYKRMPKHIKAELVGGIVYVASPLKRQHGKVHMALGSLFCAYESCTPGVDASDNTTVVLGEEGEPQPDLYLRIEAEFGGQSSTTKDDYVEGAPELIAEVAHSSQAIDLHGKRDDYGRYGVLEYLVVCLREGQLRWFDLQGDQEIAPPADGIYRLKQFPGLWIDARALLARDYRRLMAVLEQGLAAPEHAAFVERLAATQASAKKNKPKKRPRRE